MTVTLADIKAKQIEYREVIKAYNTKRNEVVSLKKQYRQAEEELKALHPVARDATHELRQLGAEFALQVENDFTPKIPGTEQPGDQLGDIWSPDPVKHNGEPVYADPQNLDLGIYWA